jgi:hypothetical protein
VSAIDRIKTRGDRVRLPGGVNGPISAKLGGTTLWAARQDELERGVQELQASIELVAASHLSTARAVLKKLARDNLQASEIDDKVFSAVLGAALRGGRLDSLVCSSKNDKPFRVFMHVSQFARWQKARQAAICILATRGTLTVRDLEKQVFGVRAYNTWSSSLHLLAQLNYLGIVRFIDDDACSLVQGLI